MVSPDGRSQAGWLRARLQSFSFAFRGLARLFGEPNARIHAAAGVAVLGAAYFLGVAPLEWAALILTILLVFAAEAFNTALESLADAAVPERHPLVGTAKDLAAAGVLIAAVGAIAVGCLVLGPHLWGLSQTAH
jgi:diacylglycerol kinase